MYRGGKFNSPYVSHLMATSNGEFINYKFIQKFIRKNLILGGNPRLMTHTAHGQKIPFKVIDYDGEFK